MDMILFFVTFCKNLIIKIFLNVNRKKNERIQEIGGLQDDYFICQLSMYSLFRVHCIILFNINVNFIRNERSYLKNDSLQNKLINYC